jgi:hypothetical protein
VLAELVKFVVAGGISLPIYNVYGLNITQEAVSTHVGHSPAIQMCDMLCALTVFLSIFRTTCCRVEIIPGMGGVLAGKRLNGIMKDSYVA